VRIYRDRLKEGDRLGVGSAWCRAFWNSPSMAMRARKKRSKRTQGCESCSTRSFKGRYGDGWIGPEFQDWLMIPSGAKRLELRFEAAPSPHGERMQLELWLDETGFFKGDLEESEATIVSANLDEDLPGLVSIQAKFNRYFVPREHELSEDSRRLSAKLVRIRWLF
jgi:hypothetical protein